MSELAADPSASRARSSRRTGRRPGDSGTRSTIESAARRQFAAQGYDRTSMRSVAVEAVVDPGLVAHYFGTKPQLFSAVVELPIDPAVVIPIVMNGDRQEIGHRLAGVMATVLGSPDGAATMTALVRCAASEPAAAEVIRRRFTHDVLTPLAAAIGMDHPEARAALTASQVIGLVMAREVVGLEPLRTLNREQLTTLIGGTIQRYLAEPLDW
ncbi:MAG: TetR family transcriptional regulator [Nakamurella sp.]